MTDSNGKDGGHRDDTPAPGSDGKPATGISRTAKQQYAASSRKPAATSTAKPALLALTFGALGVVYGDIGTSPLYALREAFLNAGDVTEDTVLGVLSLVVWSLLLVVTFKYLLVVMRADNEGEGGILALMSLTVPRGRRGGIALAIGLFGTALLYGDGMITPAISVLSAVEGLTVVIPAFEMWTTVVASVILIALFSIQRRGTAAIGRVFGPVMAVWFGVMAILGAKAIVAAPSVLRALDPTRALGFVAHRPGTAFAALGAVFLVVTGSEALYADMGHFDRASIRLGWTAVVLPSLALNYLGQGALILGNPGAVENPFFLLAPRVLQIPLVVLATCASVIASQALISGAYSLTFQAVNLGYLPRVHVDHTSPRAFGQIYIPVVNRVLMVATVALVFAFGSSSALAGAYGIAVTATMVITSLLLARVLVQLWGWPKWGAALLTAAFLVVDLAFLGANISKIPDGGWFPLVVGLIVFVLMRAWMDGRGALVHKVAVGVAPIERFISSVVDHPQDRVEGTAVYLTGDPRTVPQALITNMKHNEVLHQTVVILTVLTESVALVPPARRAEVHDMGEGFFQVFLRFGFMQTPDVMRALHEIVDPGFGIDPTDTTYFVGRDRVHIERRGIGGIALRMFALLHRNSADAVENFGLDRRSVMEVGTRVDL